MAIKLIVSVKGGNLQAIHADTQEEIEVEVFDWDNIESDSNLDGDEEEERYDDAVETMQRVL